jgi:hypothetical protein
MAVDDVIEVKRKDGLCGRPFCFMISYPFNRSR